MSWVSRWQLQITIGFTPIGATSQDTDYASDVDSASSVWRSDLSVFGT